MIERTRGETFPSRRPFEDRGAERELAERRREACERARRAAAEALAQLLARRSNEESDHGEKEETAA
jgi:hypothetical protein